MCHFIGRVRREVKIYKLIEDGEDEVWFLKWLMKRICDLPRKGTMVINSCLVEFGKLNLRSLDQSRLVLDLKNSNECKKYARIWIGCTSFVKILVIN